MPKVKQMHLDSLPSVGNFQKSRLSLRWPDYLFRGLALLGLPILILVAWNLLSHPYTPGVAGQDFIIRVWLGMIVGPFVWVEAMVILWRVPGNAVGRFLLIIALTAMAAQYDYQLKTAAASALATDLLILTGAGLAGPSLAYLMLTFPTGKVYPPHLGRFLLPLALLKFIGTALEILATPGRIKFFTPTFNPFHLTSLVPFRLFIATTIGISGILFLALLPIGGISLALRYRAAAAAEKQQIKWIVWALTLLIPISIIATELLFNYGTTGRVFIAVFTIISLGQTIFYLSIAIAILRYHLFDIDLILNRTLVYGLLTAIVVGIYILVVGVVSEMLVARSNFFSSLLATGLIAVLFQPLRERLQHTVNRFIYGEREDPYAVLSRLGERLEGVMEPEAILPTIVETAIQALKLPYAALTLRQEDAFIIAAAQGQAMGEVATFPFIYQGETIGQLQVSPRSGELLSSAERRLLADIAHQAGTAVHAVRLTADLQRSRERLVTAREEERRRLRRDLHDGLGPALGGLVLKVDAARDVITEPTAVDAHLVELRTRIQEAMHDIRRLVYNLRPPALDEFGLIDAIQEYLLQADWPSTLRVQLNVPRPLPTLPAAIEVAAYRIVQEAVNNVVRHAAAHSCSVHLAISQDKALEVAVRDDGVGLPPGWHAGVGVTAMRERAAEMGGRCVIESLLLGGTQVWIWLPLTQGAYDG